MPVDMGQVQRGGGAWSVLSALVSSDGSGSHRHVRALTGGVEPIRNLADALHFICLLHARHPGVIEYAAEHTRDSVALDWLNATSESFAAERAFIVRLVAAAGPLPSTPGQAESEAAVAGQRHALDMLAQSDRAGCATGAAFALALDWQAIRAVLDAAGKRFGVTPPEGLMVPEHETATVVEAFADALPVERALLFGAQQMLAQHRGLWDLLEARASARGRH